ncbi:Uncharacterised protein [Kluyvera intermedia]|nr:Uncharacterised protein [Kluyvera intermedia]
MRFQRPCGVFFTSNVDGTNGAGFTTGNRNFRTDNVG